MVIRQCQTKNIFDLETELLDFVGPIRLMDYN